MANPGELPSLNKKRVARRPVKQGPLGDTSVSRNQGTKFKFINCADDETGCFSVSRLYREISSVSQISPGKSQSIKAHFSNPKGVNSRVLSRLNKMKRSTTFPKDNKTLTLGERNIIEGICSNRGSINNRVVVGKSKSKIKNKQERSCFGKFNKESPDFVMPLLKDEKIYGKSLKADGITYSYFVKPNSSSIINPCFSCGNKPQHVSNSLEAVQLNARSKIKYITVEPSCSICAFCQQENKDTSEETTIEMKLKNTEDFWDETLLSSSITPGQIYHNRNENHSGLELQMGVQTPFRSRSNSTRTQSCQDSSVYMKSTSSDSSISSLYTTKTSSLCVHNAKQEQQRKHVSQSITTGEETEFNASSCENCDGNFVATKDEVEDTTKSCRTDRKIQVRVYLPTVEPEPTWERGVSTPGSGRRLFLTKERPLSPTEFKEKYKGKSTVDVNQMYLNQQRATALKEVC